MHIIFDLDGTLIDSRQGILNTLDVVSQKVIGSKFQCNVSQIGPPIAEMLKLFFPDVSGKDMNLALTEFRGHYDSQGWSEYKLYDDIKSVLNKLKKKGYKLSVATNKPKIPTCKILKDAGIEKMFENILCFDADKYLSKSSMVTEIICAGRDSYVMVGDSYDDGKAAKENGIKFVYCSYGFGLAEDYAARIQSFSELLEVV
ncbi:HAD family hydrolase [Hydrogenovibrio kuenenii]|uniref:HAD family hydrolase n=1 Tax=Hydrogenovibrio kuenenii TaxID=63658 RepID=UPI000464FBC7|nr:HAD hydrolase-like protein [Hydrogenovibrio kuenenii]